MAHDDGDPHYLHETEIRNRLRAERDNDEIVRNYNNSVVEGVNDWLRDGLKTSLGKCITQAVQRNRVGETV